MTRLSTVSCSSSHWVAEGEFENTSQFAILTRFDPFLWTTFTLETGQESLYMFANCHWPPSKLTDGGATGWADTTAMFDVFVTCSVSIWLPPLPNRRVVPFVERSSTSWLSVPCIHTASPW